MALADSGRAIGAVTRLLEDHLIRRGFAVSIGTPEDAADSNTTPKLNLFLYETAIDPHLRNQALRNGDLPPLWLNLRFLLTAFEGSESSDTAAAHEVLGRGMSTLHELNFLRLDSLVPANVRLALENNPEPLKVTFDDAGVDLLSKIMQGSEEHYRLSVPFQVRPVMIVPAALPRQSLLVGVDYTTTPATVIGHDGVSVDVIPSMGTQLDRIEPARFEAGATLVLYGEDVESANSEVVLGTEMLTVTQRNVGRLVLTAEGTPGTPIASGGTLSAGELPLMVRRRLDSTRVRTSNLLLCRLVPTLTSASLAGGTLTLQGRLLGTAKDDVAVVLLRDADGTVVRRLETITNAANQQTLTIPGASTGLTAGSYRVVLRVNNIQANASPLVVVP